MKMGRIKKDVVRKMLGGTFPAGSKQYKFKYDWDIVNYFKIDVDAKDRVILIPVADLGEVLTLPNFRVRLRASQD